MENLSEEFKNKIVINNINCDNINDIYCDDINDIDDDINDIKDDINDLDDNDDEMEEYYYKLIGCYYWDYVMEQQEKEVEETNKIEHNNKNKEWNQPGGPNKYTK